MTDVIGKAVVIVKTQIDKSSIDQTGGTIGKSLKVGALVGVAALGTLTVAGIKSVHAFEDAQAVSKKLGNVLGNMGVGDATAKVEKLADSLQRVTGVNDEVIKGGQTILATFSSLASSAGEVGGAFERASKLTVDLAAAGFGDVNSAAVQLGKALQDPVKGITALNRSGITFTATQKEQIKNFVETGKVADAQNLILKEVEKQVGGTAEAGAKGSEKMARGLDEVKESIGHLITNLVSGKNKNKSFSDSLFTVSDSLNKLAESDAWKQLGRVLSKTAGLVESFARANKRLADSWKNANLLGAFDSSNFSPATPKDLKGLKKLLLDGSLASGGRVGRTGTYLVGEQGPEIVQLPAGADVHSNSQSANMAGVAQNNTFIFTAPESFTRARQGADWSAKWGSRFGASTQAVTA